MFTATVVLPTPPLPLATATRFFTPGMGWRGGIGCGAGAGGIRLSPYLPSCGLGAQRCCVPTWKDYVVAPWHFLYFLPEPQGQGSLRPTLALPRTTCCTVWASPDPAMRACSSSRRFLRWKDSSSSSTEVATVRGGRRPLPSVPPPNLGVSRPASG